MVVAVSAEEVLSMIDFWASQDLSGAGVATQVPESLIGLAVLTMNWADTTILGLTDESATYDEEVARLRVSIKERELALLALLGENPLNSGLLGRQSVASRESVTAHIWASRAASRASGRTDLVDPEGYIRQRLNWTEREMLSFSELIAQHAH